MFIAFHRVAKAGWYLVVLLLLFLVLFLIVLTLYKMTIFFSFCLIISRARSQEFLRYDAAFREATDEEDFAHGDLPPVLPCLADVPIMFTAELAFQLLYSNYLKVLDFMLISKNYY